MTAVALTTDHPAWITTPDGTRTRLLDTGTGLWVAGFSPRDGLDLENIAGDDETKPAIAVTGADELVVTSVTHKHEDRLRSYELLAREWGLRKLRAA